MRPSLWVLSATRRQLPAFRPHVHGSPCVVCDAAAAEFRDGSMGSLSTTGCSSGSIPFAAPVITPGVVKNKTSNRMLTIEEERREDLRMWLQEKHAWNVRQDDVVDNPYLKKCWSAFCDPTATLTDDEIGGTIDFLDQFCEVKLNDNTPPPPQPERSSSSQPLENHESEKLQLQQPVLGNSQSARDASENAFLTYIRRSMTSPTDIERQLTFQRTLLDFRSVANAAKLPFFLCCGTALGAHREGHFIPHDGDIDVGVFYEDLQKPSGEVTGDGGGRSSSSSAEEEKDNNNNNDAQVAVVSLLSHIALDGRFVLLDICGVVEKGLELRFLHSKTRVALDLNVYYPPLPEDAALVNKFGPFVWTATHYEAAALRLHGMYRYRHAPFRDGLKCLTFCDPAASKGEGFLTPPTNYIVESYGEDWRTPRKYTYAEGIHGGEYKNIIDE